MERPAPPREVQRVRRQLLAIHRCVPLPLLLSFLPLTPPPLQMLAAIGETFETPFTATGADAPSATSPAPLPASFSDEVTGVIVSARKAFYRINIWTRSAGPADKARIENIGRHFKYGVLALDEGMKISEKDKVSSDVEFVSLAFSTFCFWVFGEGSERDATPLLTAGFWPFALPNLFRYRTRTRRRGGRSLRSPSEQVRTRRGSKGGGGGRGAW